MDRSLLIVEDEIVQREAIVRWFTRAGYRIVSVGHPRRALQAASFQQFDVAILDLSLPEIDGIELMRQLKRRQEAAQFIILSGYEYPLSHAKENGAYTCLVKPCNLAHLETIVDGACEKAMAESPRVEAAATVQ